MVKIDPTTNQVHISTSDYTIVVPNSSTLPKSLDSEENVYMTDFDRLLLNRWNSHMREGHFRYGLDVLETRNLYAEGKLWYSFLLDNFLLLLIILSW